MAERVEIMVVAQDSASQVLRGITSNFGGLGNAIQSITGGRLLEELAGQFVKFGKDSVDSTLKLANEVRSLQLVSGESAENVSRFIQVLDDYKIGADDAMLATKALTKNGLAPNMETLAKLSDEYLKLNSVEERNKFITENLGKAGLKWSEVLSKGSKTLMEQNDAVSESLILSQKMVDQARENEIASDNWNDAIQGLKVSLGNDLLPVLTKATNFMTDQLEVAKRLKSEGLDPNTQAGRERTKQLMEEVAVEREASTALMLKTQELGNATAATKEDEEAIKSLTKANESYLSAIGDITSQIQDYQTKESDLKAEHAELLGQKQALIAQGWWVESDAVQDINQKLADNIVAQKENAMAFDMATKDRMLAMLQEQLAVGGLDEKETAFLLEQGKEWGRYSQEAVDAMAAAQAKVSELVGSYNSVPSDITTTITTNFVSNFIENHGEENLEHLYHPGRAGGGGVNAGQLYRVNETRTEYFKPSMSGEVIPLGSGDNGGSGISVSVNVSSPITIMDKKQAQDILLPFIIDGIRQAKVKGAI